MKKVGLALLKLGLPAALFAYLLIWCVDPKEYEAFWNQPKRWELLLAAQVIASLAILLGILRWRLLVLAFHIPFTLKEALRLGFLGYLLNFVSFGSVGGDVFKAILVARDKPEKRPEAVASVLLDRAIGLLGLVILAWLTLRFLSGGELPSLLVGIRRGAGAIAIGSIAGLLLAIFAGNWFDRLIDWGARLPMVGQTLARMARAVRLLRKSPLTLLGLLLFSVCIHSLLSLSIFIVSCGVYSEYPSFREHLMVVPPGMAAGALPLAPGGIGYQEGALAGLFQQLPDLPESFSGILVATIYRLITVAVAGIGLIYYWTSHGREFKLAKESGAQRRVV